MKTKLCALTLFLLATLFNSKLAFAHRDEYIGETLVYVTLEKGETEAEYWLDEMIQRYL